MTTNTHPYRYEQIDVDDVSATDLAAAALAGVIAYPVEDGRGGTIAPHGTTMACLEITLLDADGNERFTSLVEAVVLFVDGGYRIGIAHGADADWGDVYTDATGNDQPAFWSAVESALDDWLAGGEAWAARN